MDKIIIRQKIKEGESILKIFRDLKSSGNCPSLFEVALFLKNDLHALRECAFFILQHVCVWAEIEAKSINLLLDGIYGDDKK